MAPRTDNISFDTITASDWAEEILQTVVEKGLADVENAQPVMRLREAKKQGKSPEAEFVQFPLRWK